MGAKLPPVPREPIGETFTWRDWLNKLQNYISGGIPGLGTVTSIATGTGLTGGTITSTGTIGMANQITAGGPKGSSTTVPVITYNAQGQLTTVSTANIPASPIFIMDAQDGEDALFGVPGNQGPIGPQGVMGFAGNDGKDGEDGLIRVGTGDPMLNVPIIQGGGMFQYQFVDAGVTLTVPSNYSMVVAGNFTANGDLVVNGDMRVL